MKLSKRLSMIANMVKPCHTVADIGSDHAYIPCALILNNQCDFVFAADIAKGPLAQAKSNIDKYALSSQVKPVLSDGLTNLDYCDCYIIAGMGVLTAIEIMEKGLDKITKAQQVIVQVNKDPFTLRNWIAKYHFKIDMECCIFEDHDYVAISFNPQQKGDYTQQQCYLGPLLSIDCTDTTIQYYQRLYQNNLYLLNHVTNSQKSEIIKQRIDWLKEILGK